MRTVRIPYEHSSPDSPERTRTQGIVLTAFAATVGTVLGYGFLILALTGFKRSVIGVVCVIAPVAMVIYWWYVGLRQLITGSRNRRRRSIRGVVVDRRTRGHVDARGPFVQCYLAVDDGTHAVVPGWEVPVNVYEKARLGMTVDAVVSADGRYVYSIAAVEEPDAGSPRSYIAREADGRSGGRERTRRWRPS
jgi:hypothetical protein